MKTPLAWLNLVHNMVRTGVAVAGVSFAVVLLFMQLGFLGAVQSTATLIYDALDFDIAIRSKEYLHLTDTRSFSRSRLYQAASVPGVAEANPFYVEMQFWRNPYNGRRRAILVMGMEPTHQVFKLPEIRQQSDALVRPEFLLVDRKSRREFGPKNGRKFSDEDNGVKTKLGAQQVRIVGNFELGAGLSADGAVLIGDQGFARLVPGRTAEVVNLGLVKLKGNAQADVVVAHLNRILPDDVEVLSRDDMIDYELNRWIYETQIGIIFQLGVMLSLVIGSAIVYQVLSTDVSNHISEYATLKAMGYSDRSLSGVVIQQALLLGLFGFVPGLLFSLLLYAVTSYLAGILIGMTWLRVGVVFGLSVAMCIVSALAAARKLRRVEPADLF